MSDAKENQSGGTATATKPAAKPKPAAKSTAKPKPVSKPQPTTAAEVEQATADNRTNVEKLRDQQLEAGKVTGKRKAAAERLAKATPVEQRAGHIGARLLEARVDNMSRRSDADALLGHFCLIDFGDKEFGDEARAAVEQVIGEGNAGVGSGDYGVFTAAGEVDEHGYPITANVLLRDEHAAIVSGVPYGALRPAQAGGRR